LSIHVILWKAEGDIAGHPVSRATQHRGDRSAFRLADDVPERDIKTGERHRDGAAHRARVQLLPDTLMDLLQIAYVHALDAREHVLFQSDNDSARQEVPGQPVADDTLVRLDLAEDEMRLLLAAIALNTPFQQRDFYREAVETGPDVLDDHEKSASPRRGAMEALSSRFHYCRQ
jgi:hypothetical protein